MATASDFFFGRFLFFGVTLILGGVCAFFLVPAESEFVAQYLNSYPESFQLLHNLRPVLLTVACFLPALGGLLYGFAQILDRFLIKKFFSVFSVCLCGFMLIYLLLDWQNVHGDFGENLGEKLGLIGQYYLVQLPWLLVLMSPFVLLLSSLFVLGQLSTHKELISMIQTGRGLVRVVAPLFIMGAFISLFIGILNFHWAPWGEAYKEGIKDMAKHDSLTRARNVIAYNSTSQRLWYVGLFPQNYYEGEALKNVEITFPSEAGVPEKRLRIDEASWDKETGDWTFYGISELTLAGKEIPEFLPKRDKETHSGWTETPSQLVSLGLKADGLGVPELQDWLNSVEKKSWADKQPFMTHWHSRMAKPWGCLVAVLLAAPLGVVFSRRGAFSGVIIAILLCLLLFFSSEIFLAMGEGGYLNPWLAAWAANLIFTTVALILLLRRMQNRPIYQTLRSLISLLGGKA